MKASLALLSILLLATTVQAQVAPVPMPRIVTVSGEGINKVLPDKATVRLGIVTRHNRPEEARRRNTDDARNALNAIRKLGIEERKILMESFRLQPVNEWNPETNKNEQKGFEAVRDIRVEVDNLDLVPELVALVVQEGANRIHSVEYDLVDRTAARNEALQRALTVARDKAQLMTTTLGASLGRVMQINEQSFDVPRPVMMRNFEMAAKSDAAASDAEAFAPGEIEVRAMVTLIFDLN